MAGPITWQNIAAPSYSDAMTGLARAQQSLNSGFDSFNNVIKQRTEADNANWDQVKKNNTDAFMNKLLSSTTPEQFTALRDSGQLDQMIAANGAQIDQAAARAAMDSRLGTLQQQGTANIQYANTQREAADAPILAQSRAALLKKDYAGVANLAAQMSPQAQAVIGKEMDSYQRELEVRAQTDKKAQAELDRWKAEAEKWKADTANQTAQIEISRGQLGVAQQNARTQANESKLRMDLAQEGRLQKGLDYVDTQIGNMDAGATTNSGYKKITDFLGTIKDPRKNELLTNALGKARADGALAGKSASQVIAALQADVDTGNWFQWSDNTGDKLKERLSQFNDDPLAEANAIVKAAQLQQMRTDLVSRLYPGLNEKLDGQVTPALAPALAAAGVPAFALPGASVGKGQVAAPTPAQIAADAAAAAGTAKPLPSILGSNVDARVAEQQSQEQGTAAARNTARLEREAKLTALREEAQGITPARINVLTPSEANNVLSKYGQVLSPDLQRLLRKRL